MFDDALYIKLIYFNHFYRHPEALSQIRSPGARHEAGDAKVHHFVFQHWTETHPRVVDDRAMADELIAKGVITGGMEVKVKAALHAAASLGRPISVASWRYPELLSKLLAGGDVGTRISA
mgnify:CR=1 FL=1